MPTYIIDHNKYTYIPKSMTRWRGYNSLSAKDSITEKGYAIRLKSTDAVVYECYLLHPDEEDCCVYVDGITENEIINRLINHPQFNQFQISTRISYDDIRNRFTMDQLLESIWGYFDVIEFFELGDVEPISIEDVIAKVTISSDNNEQQDNNTVIVRVRELTWFDHMLKNHGFKECPKFLWELKITEIEYNELKDYIKNSLPEKEESYFNREVALYFAEFHRRESQKDLYKGEDVFKNLGFVKGETPNYEALYYIFKSSMKSGAESLKLHITKATDGSKLFKYSLFCNGGLPLRSVLGQDSPKYKQLIKKMVDPYEQINFEVDDLKDLVNGVAANDSASLKSYCQKIQDAIFLKDYSQLPPFYGDSELDKDICQFFINNGKDALSELQSRNPFSIRWKFEINKHRKVIKPKYHVSGPDSIPLNAKFFEGNQHLKECDSFSINIAEDGVGVANITYYQSNQDFYSEDNIERFYNNVTNITVNCPELDSKVFVSEELDIYSPQIMRECEYGEYQLCHNRYIGHKDIVVIVPSGWSIENEEDYNVEEGYSYLDTTAKIVTLTSGKEGLQLILKNETGSKKVISATIPLSKVVVRDANMVEDIYQIAYFNVKELHYSLKKSDDTLRSIRSDQIEFCNDRRTRIWSTEPPLGYVYARPQGEDIYADPVKILNLGEDRNCLKINYSDSTQDSCKISITWKGGKVECLKGNKLEDNLWQLKKSDFSVDIRYVDVKFIPQSGNPFVVKVKTKFCEFQLLAPNGEKVKNYSYISLAQLQSYLYSIHGVNLEFDLSILNDNNNRLIGYRYRTRLEGSKIRVEIQDLCNDRGAQNLKITTISQCSSLTELLNKSIGQMRKMLNLSNCTYVKDAKINLEIRTNNTTYWIKKFPYKFIKEGYNKIYIREENRQGEECNISYNGAIQVLPLYNYENIDPIDIVPDSNGAFILPEDVCSWGDVFLVSGKSECVLPHLVDTRIEGEVSDEEKTKRKEEKFIPMRDNEYPKALMWSDTWQRCCYWFEKALEEHIPANSLFDLMAILHDSKLLCRLVFNLLLKGLKSDKVISYSDYEEKLKRNLLEFSRDNHFLWAWINNNDYNFYSFYQFINREDLHQYDEFLYGWYRMEMENLTENKVPTDEQIVKFLMSFYNDKVSVFMEDLRRSSLDEFLKTSGCAKDVTAKMLLDFNREPSPVYYNEIVDNVVDRLIHLNDEDETVFERYAEKAREDNWRREINLNPRTNAYRFYGRAYMFLAQMQGDLNTDIFSQKTVVRRNVLNYTSAFIDSFIELWLNRTNIN